MDVNKIFEIECRRIFALPDRVKFQFDVSPENMPIPNALGACGTLTDQDDIMIMIRDNLSVSMKLFTLSHEIVHAHQYLHKRLVPCGGNDSCMFWEGKMVDQRITPYRALPWEQEAFAWQENYGKMFVQEASHELVNLIRLEVLIKKAA